MSTDPVSSGGEFVGASDADADAARAGQDVDLTDATRDSDGVPVGPADAEADRRRAAGDDDDSVKPGVAADELR
jgi:hypothetical protein